MSPRPRPRIIWLASYPKSGNTWVRVFLANYFSAKGSGYPLDKLAEFAFSDSSIGAMKEFGEEGDYATPAEMLRQKRRMLEKSLSARQSDLFVKTHTLLGVVGGEVTIPPALTAGAVYVVRNPMDIAVSLAHHLNVSFDRSVEILCTPDFCIPRNGINTDEFWGDWSQHVSSWRTARGLRLLLLRYEDLIADPMREFARLIEFLGLPESLSRLRDAVAAADFRTLAGMEREAGFPEAPANGRRRFFRRGEAGAWKSCLTSEQAGRLAARHGETLSLLGYSD